MRRAELIACALVFLVAGCGGDRNYVPPNEVAQHYVAAIAEGDDAGACAFIEANARTKILAATHSHISCVPSGENPDPQDIRQR